MNHFVLIVTEHWQTSNVQALILCFLFLLTMINLVFHLAVTYMFVPTYDSHFHFFSADQEQVP